MSMLLVKKECCVGCALCTKVCPNKVIDMKDGLPFQTLDMCSRCGHCVAVCPEEALDHKLNPLQNQTPRNKSLDITEAEATEFLKSRRSIRWFKDEPVSKDVLIKLLDIGRYAPTGGNNQNVSYLVIDNKEKLDKVTKICMDYIGEFSKNMTGDHAHYAEVYKRNVEKYKSEGKDFILMGAPCLIITMTEKNLAFIGHSNAFLSILYTQVFAPAIGLGTCWAGTFQLVLESQYEPLYNILNIPQDMVTTGAMIVGYPKYEHKRIVERNSLRIVWG